MKSANRWGILTVSFLLILAVFAALTFLILMAISSLLHTSISTMYPWLQGLIAWFAVIVVYAGFTSDVMTEMTSSTQEQARTIALYFLMAILVIAIIFLALRFFGNFNFGGLINSTVIGLLVGAIFGLVDISRRKNINQD
jgi:hypothetical protein